MKFNELQALKSKQSSRLGRGIAAGGGKTAGRGTKGQKSRTGSKKKPGFEGGQNPLMQRLPKLHGFTSHRTKPEVVTTGQLQVLNMTQVNNQVLAAANLISTEFTRVKLVLNGEVTKKVTLELQSASKKAAEAITKAGGSFKQVDRKRRPKTNQSKTAVEGK